MAKTPFLQTLILALILGWTVVMIGPRLVATGLTNLGYILWRRDSRSVNDQVYVSKLGDSASEIAGPYWKKALKLDPTLRSALRGHGWYLAGKGDLVDAVDYWQLGGWDAKRFVLAQGMRAQHAEQLDTALQWYDLAEQLDPSLSRIWFQKGLVYEELKDWHNAFHAYQQALALADDGETHRGPLYYHLGSVADRRFRLFDQGWAYYEAALQESIANNHRGEVHYWRGEIAERWNNYQLAMAEYEQALAVRPRYFPALWRMGILYWKHLGETELAEQTLLTAVQVRPGDKNGFLALGELYKHLGRVDEAIEAYQRVLVLGSDNEVARQALIDLGGQVDGE